MYYVTYNYEPKQILLFPIFSMSLNVKKLALGRVEPIESGNVAQFLKSIFE